MYTKLYRTNTLRLIRGAFINLMDSFNKNTQTGLIEDKIFFRNQTQKSKEWTKTVALFKEFKDYINNSAHLIIVYVPDKKQIYPEKYSSYFDLNMDIDKPNKVLKDAALSLNITYIDITKEIRDLNQSNLYFKYDPHFNERGHYLFGTLIANELINIIKTK